MPQLESRRATDRNSHADPPNVRIGRQSRLPGRQGGMDGPECKRILPTMSRLNRESRSEDPPIHYRARLPRWARPTGSLDDSRRTRTIIHAAMYRESRPCKAKYYGNAFITSANRISFLPHSEPDPISSWFQRQINPVALCLAPSLWFEYPKILGEAPGNAVASLDKPRERQFYSRESRRAHGPVADGRRSPMTSRERE
jgi:hypothetical protein